MASARFSSTPVAHALSHKLRPSSDTIYFNNYLADFVPSVKISKSIISNGVAKIFSEQVKAQGLTCAQQLPVQHKTSIR